MADETQEQLTSEEIAEIAKLMGTATTPEEKSNVHVFLTKVAESKDTTKTANLNEEELGAAKLPVRTNQELALFCEEIADMKYFGDYFRKEAEITLATSLSRDAKLIEAAITTARQIGEIQKKEKKKNKGWFRRR